MSNVTAVWWKYWWGEGERLRRIIISIKLVILKAIIPFISCLYLGYMFIYNFFVYLGLVCELQKITYYSYD